MARNVYRAISRCLQESIDRAIGIRPEAVGKREGEELRLVVQVIKCDKEFLTFEVMGKRATEVMKAVLKPVIGSDTATKEVSPPLMFPLCLINVIADRPCQSE